MGRWALRGACNLTIDEDSTTERSVWAVVFLARRSGYLMGERARAREQSSSSMRFEEARRYHSELSKRSRLFRKRVSRLSRGRYLEQLIVIRDCAAPRP